MIDSKRFTSYGVLPGTIGDLQIKVHIALITAVLGNGGNNVADRFIQEIINAETQNGNFPDNAPEYGEGLGQFDRIAFIDVKQRARQKHKDILKILLIDIDKTKYSDLRKSPLLSIAFIRLKLLLIPDQIPTDPIARYEYYKEHYNSNLGASNLSHWQDSNPLTVV